MKRHTTRNDMARRAATNLFAVCLITAALAVAAEGQVDLRIKVPVKPPISKNPQPKNPPATNPNESRTPPSPNGNRPPTNVGGGTVNTAAVAGGGATREEVDSFLNDLRQFVRDRMKAGGKGGGKGIYLLKNMADQSARGDYTGCGASETNMRLALDDGAAFAEIVRAKYPNIENPTWTKEPERMVGDWRRAAENRHEIMKGCITTRLAADLRSQVEGLEQKLAKFKSGQDAGEWAGFVLPRHFDEPAVLHAGLAERYKDSFAAVGATMPEDSVFAPYDAALKALVDEAKSRAGEWKWHWNHHDPMIEDKARSWFAKYEPKGTIVKIGLMHGDWQVDGPSGGIPKGRYKRGYIMYRKPGLQQCIVTSFSYEQNYMGGGRYNEMATTSGLGHALRLQSCK